MRLFIVVALLLLSCNNQKSGEIMVDATASEIVQKVASFEGEKPVLVNFWATWCIPCVEEFPYIMELKEKYDDEFELIFVSGDFTDAKEEAKQFLKTQEVDFTTYYKIGNDNEFITTISDTWSGALPYTVIYGKDGTVSAEWEGKQEFDVFEEELLRAINEG
ncbi:MAG: TlpA family protein disulfide reductase [Balneolaceae bacterium]|nr:TlpA family protein disulfide reductase [Balneolaceae bacterium]MBO6547450.1 TlpA family protein disulfide reductase [Balneolaceae bacterium]MBO6647603.1 TlpA family protein disulfide reductase [Balneolaceae bacterium]